LADDEKFKDDNDDVLLTVFEELFTISIIKYCKHLIIKIINNIIT